MSDGLCAPKPLRTDHPIGRQLANIEVDDDCDCPVDLRCPCEEGCEGGPLQTCPVCHVAARLGVPGDELETLEVSVERKTGITWLLVRHGKDEKKKKGQRYQVGVNPDGELTVDDHTEVLSALTGPVYCSAHCVHCSGNCECLPKPLDEQPPCRHVARVFRALAGCAIDVEELAALQRDYDPVGYEDRPAPRKKAFAYTKEERILLYCKRIKAGDGLHHPGDSFAGKGFPDRVEVDPGELVDGERGEQTVAVRKPVENVRKEKK